jgi:hypothetical protein
MATDNVTPFPTAPKESRGQRRGRRKPPGLRLEDPPGGPSSLRLIQALRGVCEATERFLEDGDLDPSLELSTAAAVLSLILQERIA